MNPERIFAEWEAGRLTQTDLSAVVQNQMQPRKSKFMTTFGW